MTPPLISIVLCTYNGERFLRTQMDSLLEQDYPNIEVVAVDDGSTDDTVEILEQYRARDSRLRVYRNLKNLGFIKNFERAISLSTGEFIAPCDQDDVWSLNKLSQLMAARGNAAMVYCDSRLIDEQGNSLGVRVSDKLNMYRGSDPRALLFENCVSGHALLCTRELAMRAMPFPADFYHDWWLALMAAATGRIEYRDECLVNFRQHQHSFTDMSGRKRGRKQPAAGSGLQRVRQRMESLARLKDFSVQPHRDFLIELERHFTEWRQSYFSPELAFFIFRNRKWLFRIKKNIRISKPLDYFFGLQLKKLVKPYKYVGPTA